VAFSPDGKTLATGDCDGTVKLWNLVTGQQTLSLATGSIAGNSVAFSPDGKTLATGDRDGTAKLWNVATGQQVGSLKTGPDSVWSVAFSPDGKTLATSDEDGTAKLWNVGYLVDVLTRLCSQVGGSLTRAEWARYVPPGPSYRNVCAQRS
jgi:WD40 repeat protein